MNQTVATAAIFPLRWTVQAAPIDVLAAPAGL